MSNARRTGASTRNVVRRRPPAAPTARACGRRGRAPRASGSGRAAGQTFRLRIPQEDRLSILPRPRVRGDRRARTRALSPCCQSRRTSTHGLGMKSCSNSADGVTGRSCRPGSRARPRPRRPARRCAASRNSSRPLVDLLPESAQDAGRLPELDRGQRRSRRPTGTGRPAARAWPPASRRSSGSRRGRRPCVVSDDVLDHAADPRGRRRRRAASRRPRGRSDSTSRPARIASSMSWLT